MGRLLFFDLSNDTNLNLSVYEKPCFEHMFRFLIKYQCIANGKDRKIKFYLSFLAGIGIILSAAYFLWLYGRLFFGNINSNVKSISNLNNYEIYSAILSAINLDINNLKKMGSNGRDYIKNYF